AIPARLSNLAPCRRRRSCPDGPRARRPQPRPSSIEHFSTPAFLLPLTHSPRSAILCSQVERLLLVLRLFLGAFSSVFASPSWPPAVRATPPCSKPKPPAFLKTPASANANPWPASPPSNATSTASTPS